MTERIQPIETQKRPALKERGGFRGLLGTISKFAFGTETLQERWDGFKAKLKKPERQTEAVQAAEPAGSEGGFFERLGRSVDSGISKARKFLRKRVEGAKNSLGNLGEQFRAEVTDIDDRRKKLGVVGTVKSYFMDLGDGIRGVGDRIAIRWKVAEMAQMKEQRTRLNAQYIKDQLEKKELLAKGTRRKDLPERLLTQKALRMRLRPIRETELLAKYELAQLREEASRVRRRIEGKENVVAVLEAERQARLEKEARRSNPALVLQPVAA